jgi:aubergine-like protein
VPAKGRKKDDLNLYKLTKRLTISELAVPTQVVLSKTLMGKGVTSIVSKVLTQVVAKLNNGAPWGLVRPECSDAPTMVCGVDVWHGSGKSIMGFTASLDQNFSKYTSDVKTQDMKEEMSAEIASCVKGCAEGFKALNGVWPARIIIYRDGVSEGQFQTALNQEVGAVQDMLEKSKIDAKLLYVIVNKRVDTKILSAQKDEGCVEGTIVDQTITRTGM